MKITIFATPNDNGMWTLTRVDGGETEGGYEYPTKKAALDAASKLWPTNSVWHGRKVRGGWQIEIRDQVLRWPFVL